MVDLEGRKDEAVKARRAGLRSTSPQLMMMILAWTGNSSFFGWAGLENSLAGRMELWGRIAYVRDRRYLVRKNPDLARHLFQLTIKDVPAGSPFRKLSQDQPARLLVK